MNCPLVAVNPEILELVYLSKVFCYCRSNFFGVARAAFIMVDSLFATVVVELKVKVAL